MTSEPMFPFVFMNIKGEQVLIAKFHSPTGDDQRIVLVTGEDRIIGEIFRAGEGMPCDKEYRVIVHSPQTQMIGQFTKATSAVDFLVDYASIHRNTLFDYEIRRGLLPARKDPPVVTP